MIGTGNVDVSVFPVAEKALWKIICFLQKTEPFSFLDLATDEKELHRLFDEEHIENIVAYIEALQEIGASASFDDKYSHAVGVLKLIQGMSQLGNTLNIFKSGMIDFAHKLHDLSLIHIWGCCRGITSPVFSAIRFQSPARRQAVPLRYSGAIHAGACWTDWKRCRSIRTLSLIHILLFVSFFLPPKCTSFLEKMAIAGELWQTAPSAALETPV